MQKVTLEITLTLKAPLLSQSSESKAFGIDAVVAQDTDGRYCLPRKLIKGCLRQAWREMNEAVGDDKFKPDVARWLGEDSQHGSYEPKAGLLRFDDFVNAANVDVSTLFRIKIDENRRAVQKGAYQVIEAPFAAGEVVIFRGAISYLANDDEAKGIRRAIDLGLRWITNLGAFENIGFGQLLKVQISDPEPTPEFTSATVEVTAPDYIDICINPKSPFCVAQRRVTNNLFESDTRISGGVLKGAVAATWLSFLGNDNTPRAIDEKTDDDRRELGKYYERLRFTHAFPSRETNKKPVQFPYSIVAVTSKEGAIRLYDMASCDRPVLLVTDGSMPKLTAPSFCTDWKRRARNDVDRLFGWPDVDKKLEIHTAIENNRAKDESLFAYEMIVPMGVDWYARVGLYDVPEAERATVAKQLSGLLQSIGIHSFGKTKAEATVRVLNQETRPYIESTSVNAGEWIVTLQTPALLCDQKQVSVTNDLKESYSDAWRNISTGALELVRYFAGQSLAGGNYLYNRFQKGNPYNPYLLTDAGSVFVLKTVTTDAAGKVEDWKQKGLPLPDWAVEHYTRSGKDGRHWSNCPYVPQNGYGEIAVDLAVHYGLQPKEGEFYEIP